MFTFGDDNRAFGAMQRRPESLEPMQPSDSKTELLNANSGDKLELSGIYYRAMLSQKSSGLP